MENKLFKKISRTGGITIPAQIRHQMNIPKGAAVKIVQTEDNSLLIKKHIPTCMCCGTAENVKVFNNVELCTTCASKFAGGGEHGN